MPWTPVSFGRTCDDAIQTLLFSGSCAEAARTACPKIPDSSGFARRGVARLVWSADLTKEIPIMSETEQLGATLSPEENQFFETGGNAEIPRAETGTLAEGSEPGDHARAGDAARDGQARVEKMVSLSALH